MNEQGLENEEQSQTFEGHPVDGKGSLHDVTSWRDPFSVY